MAFDVKTDHFSQLGDEKQLVLLYQQKNWAEFVKCAIKLKKNRVISGETSSGKTTDVMQEFPAILPGLKPFLSLY